ncbi:hypothetical protein ACTZWW_19345 [Salinarimonas sp. NSM]|uniref:hypothetical protein n=1 Tax=Salinarimonas sp. NSM TaxID=3458003 RepID=UPI004035FCDC
MRRSTFPRRTLPVFVRAAIIALLAGAVAGAAYFLDVVPGVVAAVVAALTPAFHVVRDYLGLTTPLEMAAHFGVAVFAWAAVVLSTPFGRAIVDRVWPVRPPILKPVRWRPDVPPDHPEHPRPLVGRDAELSALKRFAGSASGDGPRWTELVGVMGVGKTKLAMEWLSYLESKGWDAGLLDGDVRAIARTRLRQKTAIVIDEATRDPDLAAKLNALLATTGQVRVLLVDQLSLDLEVSRDAARDERIRDAFHPGARLTPLGEGELHRIAPERTPNEVAAAEGRPLLVLLGPDPRRTISVRAGERVAAASAEDLRYLAFAALAGPLPLAEARRHGAIPRLAVRARLHEGVPDQDLKRRMPAIAPEPLANEVLLRWARECDEDDWRSLLAAAVAANAAGVEARLRQLWLGFARRPEDGALCEAMQAAFDACAPERAQAAHQRAERILARLVQDGVLSAETDRAVAELSALANGRPADRTLQALFAGGAVTAILHCGQAQEFAKLERWGEQLVDLVDNSRWVDDAAIQLRGAMGAVNAIYHFGMAQDFTGVERWGARLVGLANNPRWVDDAAIQLHGAMGAVNAMSQYGNTKDFAGLERWGEQLVGLVDDPRWVDDAVIQLRGAMAAVNAIFHYGNARDFAGLERWGARLAELADDPRWVDDAVIQLERAKGAVNAMSQYGDAKDFAGLERWGARLVALAEHPRWADDATLQLLCATGAFNSIVDYGRAQDFAGLERWGARLVALAENARWVNDAAIQFERAKGAGNAMIYYGQAQDFAGLERWGEQLIVLTDDPRWVDDAAMQLARAKGAGHAIGHHGAARDFIGLERWGSRLVALVDDPRWAEDAAVQLNGAIGAANAINHVDGPGLARWRAQLRRIALRMPHVLEIQELAGRHTLAFAQSGASDSREIA